MPKRKRREPELNPTIGRSIVAAIADGNFPGTAARLEGVSLGTLQAWLARGEAGEQPYADFAEAYRQAEAECESAVVRTLKGAIGDDWRAGVQFLGRRFPDRWSDHAGRLAVFGADENPTLRQAGFEINIHLTREEGGLPTTGYSPAIDVTPTPAVRPEGLGPLQAREQPPRDGSRDQLPAARPDDLRPTAGAARPLTKAQEWNDEVRARGAGYVMPPVKKRPGNGGNGDPSNWN